MTRPKFRNLLSFRKYTFVTESYKPIETEDKTGLAFSLYDKPGILSAALQIFTNNKINLTYISSKPSPFKSKDEQDHVDFFVDFEGTIEDENVKKVIRDLKAIGADLEVSKVESVPWFPKCKKDLNFIGRYLLQGGVELSSDHPGFNDPIYGQRRNEIAKLSNTFEFSNKDPFYPHVIYSEEETKLWSHVWDILIPLHQKHACEEFKEAFHTFTKECRFSRDEIPQIADISNFLYKKTKFIYRPVGGLLSQREFLNGLAFKVFHSTQYVRHPSKPLYTPEPDVIHEFLGHAPLFAVQDFADFSQIIGLSSLGASDDDIERLGTIYWFTVEFGVLLEKNKNKIYGAGILSSISEMEWAASDKPRFHDFNIYKMSKQQFSITDIQTDYFLAPSFKQMKQDVLNFADSLKKPFNITYNTNMDSVKIDRKISTIRKEEQIAYK